MIVTSCQFNATLSGIGDFVVASATAGHVTPENSNVTDGKTYTYYSQNFDSAIPPNVIAWEAGSGNYIISTHTLKRTKIIATSNGDLLPVNFTTPPIVDVYASPGGTLEPPYPRYDIAQFLTDAQKAQSRANIAVEKKNYISNPAMMISQENGNTTLAVSGYYPVDQFVVSFNPGSGAVSHAQVASYTPGGSPNRLRLITTTANAVVGSTDFLAISHNIEGFRTSDLGLGTLAAKTITVQSGIKAPAGTYSIALRNASDNRSYVGEFVVAVGEANTDVIKTVTLKLDTAGAWARDNTIGINLVWTLMSGSNWRQTAGSWQASGSFAGSNQSNFMSTIGNTFELFDVGLYEGPAAPPFRLPDYIATLFECMRYWEKGTSQLSFEDTLACSFFYSSSRFKVTKRAIPTVTLFGYEYYTSGTPTSFSPSVNGISIAHFSWLASGLTTCEGVTESGTWTASARL